MKHKTMLMGMLAVVAWAAPWGARASDAPTPKAQPSSVEQRTARTTADLGKFGALQTDF